ncbi:MAG: serine hydrolase domain-containing protein, partial [Pyrinomonadaceae bacterium]
MKIRTIVSSLLLTGMLLNAIGAMALGAGGVVIVPKTVVFNKAKFDAAVNQNRLGAKNALDGYAAVIIKDGNVVSEVAGGSAIRSGGGLSQVDMSTSTPTDIGSNFKLISFISLLSIFQKRTAINRALTVEVQLNQPILGYLPKSWRAFVVAPPKGNQAEVQAIKRIGNVTFAQLMSHTSGFRNLSFGNLTPSPFNYIDAGIQSENIGKRVYANFNATILTYLWPKLTDSVKAALIDQQIMNQKSLNNNHEV